MTDAFPTHDEVLRWLSPDVKRELLMALPPEQRGWWTREEMAQDGGCFVEAINMEHREAQYFRVGW